MKPIKWSLRFGTVLFSAAILQFPLSAADKTPVPDSVLLTLENKVEVALASQAIWAAGQTNQTLRVGDRVRTGVRSRATVRLSDLTVLRVNELTTLQIRPPSQPGKQAALDLQRGAAYFFSRERPTEMEFRTPLASAAIRGTEFHLEVADDGTTTVTLIDGEVALNNAQGALDLVSGEQGIVEPGKAPRKTAMIEAINIIQWCLYYPAILDLEELNLTDAEIKLLAPSLEAYQSGDLLKALENYPANRVPVSDSEKIYLAELLLSVGQVEEAVALIKDIRSPLADALGQLIAAVKHQAWSPEGSGAGVSPARSKAEPHGRDARATTATEWMAESYYQQSRADVDPKALEAALKAARAATEKSPNFGFAWARLAEMEFSFGHVPESLDALEKSLQLSPRNAQALALKGFLLAAQNKIDSSRRRDNETQTEKMSEPPHVVSYKDLDSALACFEAAIAVDGALGNAWLGRGLTKIRQGQREDGVRDLQTAAVLEPQRSILRSYLGKAFSNAHDNKRADRELGLAKRFDPNDPTPWLYSALLNQEEHRFNEGIRDLEKSQELNDNRRVYRSRFLLDQDRAVRSSSLAAIYRDNGMTDVSVREDSRALVGDYGNYSAHLFLANSFDQLRDRTGFNLRYETVWFNELLLANLLAPVGAGTFSQNISQQEYSRLFDVKKIGLATTTTVRSDGQYHEEVSQFGTLGKLGYSLDLDYQHNDKVGSRGRPNNELDLIHWFSTFKYQLTPQDTIFLQTEYRDFHSGDNFQYYNWRGNVRTNFTFDEFQTPNVLIGYHREWSPGVHTLLLGGRLANDQRFSDRGTPQLLLFTGASNDVNSVASFPFDVSVRSEVEVYTVEAEQIFQSDRQTFLFGGRYQSGDFETRSHFAPNSFQAFFPVTATNSVDDFQRLGAYAYYTLEPLKNLFLTAGLSYDQVTFPRNFRAPPTSSGETSKDAINPKAALVYSPADWITLRGIYTRSLSGVSLDQDYRLEPPQLAGFVQTFRTVIPESVVGSVSAPELETFGAAVDFKFKTRTYIGLRAEQISSDVNRDIGVFDFPNVTPPIVPSSTRERLNFEERSASIIVNQLLSDEWSAGASYKFTSSELKDRLAQIPAFVLNSADNTTRSDLHNFTAYLLFNHPSGFFARGEVNCLFQDNTLRTSTGNTADTVARKEVNLPSEDFAQFNAYLGWRFPRQLGDVTFAVLNISGGDYHLNPLNSYPELPHERVYAAQLRLRF